MSPIELFTGVNHLNQNHLQPLHVYSCPVYVLEPQLQDAKKLPKWKQRSHRGIYLGLSKVHSSNVHLVLNPNTGHISPQYHLVFDDSFFTVYFDGKFDSDVWSCLVSSNLEIIWTLMICSKPLQQTPQAVYNFLQLLHYKDYPQFLSYLLSPC